MTFTKTTDISDAHPEATRVAELVFRSYGARAGFEGTIATLKIHEDNALVRKTLSESGRDAEGRGKVLVIDGGGSLRRALVGDQLAALASDNGWSGIVVNGCIRDSADIATIDIGLFALGTNPRKSEKSGFGTVDVPVSFASLIFVPGHYLWADEDGIVVADTRLTT